MAASDLHSSPVLRALHDRSLTLSSSPLPDLFELIAHKPKAQPLRSGSAAVPVPTGATTAFTSASELLRAAQAAGGDSLDAIDDRQSHAPTETRVKGTTTTRTTTKPAKTSRVSKTTKRVAKTVITLSSDDVTPQSPATKSSTTAIGKKEFISSLDHSKDGSQPKAITWKKFKTPVSPAKVPIQEEEADSEKPRAKTKTQRKVDKPEIVSKHFPKKAPEGIEAPRKSATTKSTTAFTLGSTNLEPALQRRMDWTPPRPDTRSLQSEIFRAPTDGAVEEDRDTDGNANHVFKQLRDKYGHMESSASGLAPDNLHAKEQPLGKRKAIEMISVYKPHISAEANRTPSPAKEKAPKKKPRTITEVAVAAYQTKTVEDVQESKKDESLLGHFSLQKPVEDSAKAPNARGKGKAPKVTKRTKKAAPKHPELLSPRAAMRQSAAQDFVFGTSSQLAREQSPTFLRELHAALRASNMASDEDLSTEPQNIGGALAAHKPTKGLWSVSARDEGGELVDVEVIDLVESPAFPQYNAILDPWEDLPPPDPALSEPNEADISLLELGSRTIPITNGTTSRPPPPRPRSTCPQDRITINSVTSVWPDSPDSSYPLVTNLLADEMPPPSNQQQSREDVDEAASPTKVVDCAQQARPNYELFTDAKLSREISRFGFKVVKSRTAMISLLDQCWQSKNKAPGAGTLFSTTSAAAVPRAKKAASEGSLSSATASPTKRPVRRSKKSTVIEVADDIESAAAPIAKRGRGRPKKAVEVPSVSAEVQAVLDSPVRKRPNQDMSPSTPTKKRGRPRKVDDSQDFEMVSALASPPKSKAAASKSKSKAAARLPVEIKDSDLDSDDEQALTSPEQLFSPGPAEVSISDGTEVSLNISPSDLQSALFSYITKAVTSAPRSKDPSNPSWYEKMLMYDPIILEDLAAWLNSGQLTKVGYDGEVAPAEVKKWCESRSICCLWRINVHGRERKRF